MLGLFISNRIKFIINVNLTLLSSSIFQKNLYFFLIKMFKRAIFSSGNSMVVMAKKGLHPKFYPEAKVFCNGEVVMKVGGSLEEYVVDLWSGNHPFFQGASNAVIIDEGQVNRFRKRFAELENFSSVKTVSGNTNQSIK